MEEQRDRSYCIRRGGNLVNTLQPMDRICFVFAKLLDDNSEQVLANIDYILRSTEGDLVIKGTTDEEGILRHELLPDDYFEIECNGQTETVEVYYMDEMERYDDNPWYLRMRGVNKKPVEED